MPQSNLEWFLCGFNLLLLVNSANYIARELFQIDYIGQTGNLHAPLTSQKLITDKMFFFKKKSQKLITVEF